MLGLSGRWTRAVKVAVVVVDTSQDTSTINNIEPRNVDLAGEILANAFRGYPFFEYCLGKDNYERMAPKMFASFVRWTMLYGKAWMTTDLTARIRCTCEGGSLLVFRTGVDCYLFSGTP
jgi:hypothetical protein